MNEKREMKFSRGWRLMLPAIALVIAVNASTLRAEEDAKPEAAAEATSDASAAWMPAEGRTVGQAMDALIDSANERYAKAQEDKTTGIELELLYDFEAFAEAWPGSEEAIIALIQSATLAGMANDFDRAEKNLNLAAELTDDPELEYEINRNLNSLKVRPGMPAPAFSVTTVEGTTLTPADMKGKVFVLDFWATWCGPCLAELPNLKKVYETWHPKGLEVVSISLDSDREYFDRFIEEQGMTWTHVYNADQAEGQDLADRYGVVSIPRVMLIGTDGVILESNLRGGALNEAVAAAIGEDE